ncbi:MAG: hypothetical protein L7F78_09725 [Syntrophales bacterium LBB04]|nr:hypothetical protein [Syntrophales bacterium LBB04]
MSKQADEAESLCRPHQYYVLFLSTKLFGGLRNSLSSPLCRVSLLTDHRMERVVGVSSTLQSHSFLKESLCDRTILCTITGEKKDAH